MMRLYTLPHVTHTCCCNVDEQLETVVLSTSPSLSVAPIVSTAMNHSMQQLFVPMSASVKYSSSNSILHQKLSI